MHRTTSPSLLRSVQLGGALLATVALSIPVLQARDGSAPPGGDNDTDYGCDDATNWPENNRVVQHHTFLDPGENPNSTADDRTGSATISMLFIVEEHEETCGDDGVDWQAARCTVKWRVKIGATSVLGEFEDLSLTLYKDGVPVTIGASGQSLDDTPETTDYFTVNQACGNFVPTVFDVRPDFEREFTSLAVDQQGVWSYPMSHSLKVACERCDVEGSVGDGGDGNINAPGL